MNVVLALLIGLLAGWFARDAVPPLMRRVRPEAPSPAQPIHTVKAGDGWQVRRGDTEALAKFPTKAEAQDAGRDQAKRDGVEHVVHRRDDTVGERHDYSDAATPADDASND